MDEDKLIQKLRLIEALHAGAKTPGERQAAEAARQRIQARLAEVSSQERPIEYKFTLSNRWSRQVLCALLRRYGLNPYRYRRQRYTTVMVRVPQRFVDETLWPEFLELDAAFQAFVEGEAQRVVSKVLCSDTSEASVLEEGAGADAPPPPPSPPPPPPPPPPPRSPSPPPPTPQRPRDPRRKVQRNDPCPCCSGRKYKKCCGRSR